jgi:TDG/mug DNA glycosylase family protein
VPEPLTYVDDVRLPEFGYGITNLIARPTPGVGDLRPHEYVAGRARLQRKVRRWRPAVVALVGVTVYRAAFPGVTGPVSPGPQPQAIAGARVHVLPNPSGRNANFTYAEMLDAFRGLKRASFAIG